MALNIDAFDEARGKLEEQIDFKKYYNDVVNEKEQLGARSLVPCPLHDERTASFKYFEETNSFYCFGCERSGTIIEFHYHLVRRSKDSYTKVQAVLDLSRDYGIEIPNIFDDKYINEANLFKAKPSKINKNKKYPIKWVLNEIEQQLMIHKKRDMEYYIQMCNTVDNIYIVGNNTEEKLLEVLDRLHEGD